MRYWLIVPAAGVGRRFGDAVPKQYAPIHGRTVLEWSLAPFVGDSRCVGIVVALAASDTRWAQIAAKLPSISATQGGSSRSGSVRNGLAALSNRAQPDDWILVHDAARPCLPAEDLNRLLERLASHPIGGILAAPAADTLKATDSPKAADTLTAASDGQQIARTVDRSGLWRALTPQMFRYRRLCEALDAAAAAGRSPTDESQALEWLGDRPQLVEGSAANIKITSAADLVIAAALLAAPTKPGTAGRERRS